jgi:hypothetical protein
MLPYRLNMAKGQVIPLAQRRLWFRWLMLYFAITLVVLGFCVSVLTHDILGLRRQRGVLEVQERQFLAQRGGGASVERHAAKVCHELNHCSEQLDSLSGFYDREFPPAALLLGLANVLPTGMDLGEVGIDATAGRLTFLVYVPVGRQIVEAETPPNLIGQWSVAPLLAGRVSGLTAEKSERLNRGGIEVLGWHFTGALKGGK